ncbi:MAG: hypothetical protein ACRDJE_21985 [Dehalococcoidia bacterium]
MPAKSITLSDDELRELRDLLTATGETEAAALKRATLRGLRELRFEQGLLAYLDGADSAEAAAIAGLPRAAFLAALAERGVPLLSGPSTLASELAFLATRLDNSRLAAVADALITAQATIVTRTLDRFGEVLREQDLTLEDLVESGRNVRGDLLAELYGIDAKRSTD